MPSMSAGRFCGTIHVYWAVLPSWKPLCPKPFVICNGSPDGKAPSASRGWMYPVDVLKMFDQF